MRNRIKQIASLAVPMAALSLVGCAWVQTPETYAFSNGYRPVEIQNKKYFCRREQPEVQGSPAVGVNCLTQAQLSAMVARLNSARFTGGLPFETQSFGYEYPGAINSADSTFVNGQGLYNGVGVPR